MQHVTQKKKHICIYTDCSDWESGGGTKQKFTRAISGEHCRVGST